MARAEITHSGTGTHTAFVLHEQDRELVRIRGTSLKEVLAFLAERYPDLPVRVVPRRNPAGGKGTRTTLLLLRRRGRCR